jgi:hypothetical protein
MVCAAGQIDVGDWSALHGRTVMRQSLSLHFSSALQGLVVVLQLMCMVSTSCESTRYSLF